MAVSANTLFHFTGKDNLKEILKSSFFPKYSLEDLRNVTSQKSSYIKSYIPMVCFCDLPFSQIKDHIDFYGDYGIGLRKREWGLKKGISPITYVPQNSLSAIHIKSISDEISAKLKSITERKALRKQLQNFYKYVKPYDGNVKNRKIRRSEYRIFYEEREWRFVPKNFPVLAKKSANSKRMLKENKKMEAEESLDFSAKDIKYIIVKTEKEIPMFVDFIENDLKDKFNTFDRKLLVSKLISVEQIKDDI